MKHVSTLDVKVDDSLKVKRRVIIHTGHGAKASSKERTRSKLLPAATQARMSTTSLEKKKAPGQEPKLFITTKKGGLISS